MMDVMPGVDSAKARFVALVKIDLPVTSGAQACLVLAQLAKRLLDKGFTLGPAPSGEPEGFGPCQTALVGFSARFFGGELSARRDHRRIPTRFGLVRPRPKCLQQMRLRGDNRFKGVGLPGAVRANESDLLIKIETDEEELLSGTIEDIRRQPSLKVKAVECGLRPKGDRNAFGYREEVSNLQDLRCADPDQYRQIVVTNDGEETHPAYAGGTYLAYRKYRLHVDRWFAEDLEYETPDGRKLAGDAARDRMIGRVRASGKPIDEQNGEPLEENDDAISARCPGYSHLRQANPRGHALTQYGDPVSPRPARLLRRGFDGLPGQGAHDVHSLLFLCFQSEIQTRGFEFIHNNWVMAEGFFGCPDPLMDPGNGFVEPLDGCYYFIPRFTDFPGDVFFA